MNRLDSDLSVPPKDAKSGARWPWFLALACVALVLVAIFLPRPGVNSPASPDSSSASAAGDPPKPFSDRFARGSQLRSSGGTALTAVEIVAAKVSEFGRSRREIVERIAHRLKKKVPPEVKKFFDAIEAGNWEEIEASWKALRSRSGQYDGTSHSTELNEFWPAVLDAYGAAEQAHLWPAQKLLDYGNAILDSLRPGMVYVGGTDPGRWIPELLNDTSDGERHIIVTQNAFADGRYLDYMTELYGDRFATLTKEDSQRAFQEYLADAEKRLRHDQEFPDEPKQVHPGEDIKFVDGVPQDSGQMKLWSVNEKNQRVQVSGQVAVMAINEKLLQTLMQKNSDASFAMETSFPFKSMYAETSTLGPIMELRARDEQNALTPERAQQAVDYWRSIAQQAASDPEAGDSENFRKAYSKMAAEQAALLLNRKFTAEAEQAFRSAVEICPTSPEAVFRYVNMLVGQNRINDAIPVAANALAADPHNAHVRDLLERLKAFPKN